MLQISIALSLLLIVDSYILGKCLCYLFKWNAHHFPLTTIGFFVIIGFFQFFIFAFVRFQLSVYYLIFIQYIILIIPVFLALKVKVYLIPTKKELLWIVCGIMATFLLCILMGRQTLGETAFDSNFYLSMVIENSSSKTLGQINGYTGNFERASILHNYQGFYYFHSLLLKNVRSLLHLDSIPLTPIYLWTSAIMYFYMLSDIMLHSIHFLLEDKKWFPKLVALFFVLVYFTNYFNISFNFYGNTWKTLSIACIMMVLYDFIKNSNKKVLLLLVFLNSALIGFSSSGFFIAAFIQISFFFFLVWSDIQDYEIYLKFLLSCLALLIFIVIYFADSNILLSLIVLVIYCLAGCFAFFTRKFNTKQWSLVLKIFKISFFVVLAALILLSYLVHNSMFSGGDARFNGYSFFFRLNSLGDMTLNYFRPLNKIELIRNCVFWLIIMINCIQINYEKKYKKFMLIIVMLFINPLVTPVVVKYMTNIVYSRSFEIFINPFCLVIFYAGLIRWLENKKILENIVLISIELGAASIILININTYYSKLLIPGDGYNPLYRITENQWQLYVNLMKELKESNLERPVILNQDIAVKAYVSNISVLIDANTARSAPAYSDSIIEAPSEWLNIFYVRDYYGQHVWANDPDYSRICDAIIDSECDYVIMDKDVVVFKDDLYLPLWFDARGCSNVIYENEKFVLLKVRK